MVRLPLRFRIIAACLSFVAGFVDSLGFIHLGGYFVSFMSGNSTRMAVGIASRLEHPAFPIALILLFIFGVMIGTTLNHVWRDSAIWQLLISVAALIGLAALLATIHFETTAAFLLPVAMGAMNAVFMRDGEVAVGVTYMTGALVKIGQRLAGAFFGGDKTAWVPFFLLWLGLVTGAICGAHVYPLLGLKGLWMPVLILTALSTYSARARRHPMPF